MTNTWTAKILLLLLLLMGALVACEPNPEQRAGPTPDNSLDSVLVILEDGTEVELENVVCLTDVVGGANAQSGTAILGGSSAQALNFGQRFRVRCYDGGYIYENEWYDWDDGTYPRYEVHGGTLIFDGLAKAMIANVNKD